jgi:CRP/FNR family transcriptional regulator, cyclic AMP receptor protein
MAAAPDSALAGRDFQAGEVMFREGDAGAEMYVIQRGSVRLSKLVDDVATTLCDLGEGDFVGELALVRGRPHPATATALSPVKCLVIDTPTLEAMVTGDDEIAVRFIKELTERLASSYDLLAVIGRRDARTRLCLAIARHAEASGETRPEGLWVSKRLGDIGDECAVPAAEVGDIAKQLVSQKLLRIKRDGILVPDLGRLYGYVKSGGP